MEILVLAVMVAIVVLVGYALAHAWRHVMREEGPLPIHALLRRQPAPVGDMHELALATRRCAFCDLAEACRSRLQTGEPLPADCPNAHLWLNHPAA